MLPLELVQEVVTIFVLEEREFQSRSPFRKATKGYLLPLLRVDRTFYDATLPHLYEHIEYKDFQNPSFVQIITEKPHYGSFVKHCCWSIGMMLYERADGVIHPSPSEHRQVLDAGLSLLKCFQRLESLAITYGFAHDQSTTAPVDAFNDEPIPFLPTSEQLQTISLPCLEALRITDNSKYSNPLDNFSTCFYHALSKSKSEAESLEALSPWPFLDWFRTAGRIKSLALGNFDFRDAEAVKTKRGWKGLERVIIDRPNSTFSAKHLLAVFLHPLKDLKCLTFNFGKDQGVGCEFLCSAFLADLPMVQLKTLSFVDVLPFLIGMPEPFARIFPAVSNFSLTQSSIDSDEDDLVGFITSLFPEEMPCPALERLTWNVFSPYPFLLPTGTAPLHRLLDTFASAERFPSLKDCMFCCRSGALETMESCLDISSSARAGERGERGERWAAVEAGIKMDFEALLACAPSTSKFAFYFWEQDSDPLFHGLRSKEDQSIEVLQWPPKKPEPELTSTEQMMRSLYYMNRY